MKYDSAGNRCSKSVTVTGSGTTNRTYIVDTVGELPVILLEIEPTGGTIEKMVIYANSEVLAAHTGDHQASRVFYLHDRLGSVRMIIDDQAAAQNSYTYDPYGSPIATEVTETTENNYKFTGQRYDDEIGWYYLRARMYDPELGRFVSRDPVAGEMARPLTLHKYHYCNNDPVNWLDPAGLAAYYFTFSAMQSFGYNLCGQTGIAWDDQGNWGIIGIAAEGIGTPTASMGLSFGITNADTIMDLKGAGWSLGGGIGSGLVGGAVEYIRGKGYHGIEFNIGGSVSLPSVEFYAQRTQTYISLEHSETLGFEDIVGMGASEAFYQSDTHGEARFILKFMAMTGIDLNVLMD